MTIARIKIELTYDLESYYGGLVNIEDLRPQDIHNDLENQLYEDLIDLMRGDRLRSWSEIEIEEEN